jgi:hypothetical protein
MLRDDLPNMLLQWTVAREGYYAAVSGKDHPYDFPGDGRIHIYRIGDGHEWAAEVPSPSWLQISAIYHVDADEIWYSGHGPVARQRIDALGPGTPAP